MGETQSISRETQFCGTKIATFSLLHTDIIKLKQYHKVGALCRFFVLENRLTMTSKKAGQKHQHRKEKDTEFEQDH